VRTPRPLIALVGRPNVGKSTLFNRLVRRRAAIVEDELGVTRDRNYGDFAWDGRELSAVDTGGFEPVPGRRDGGDGDPGRRLVRQVQEQAQLAVDEAAAVVLVVDGREGPTAVDHAVAGLLRRSGKPLFVAVNKVDGPHTAEEVPLAEFYELGFGEVHPVSAEHGRGVADLVDAIVTALDVPRAPDSGEAVEGPGGRRGRRRGGGRRSRQAEAEEVEAGEAEEREAGDGEGTGGGPDEASGEIRLAVVGRPNVGKSTLVNALLGQPRLVVSEVPGTTRDSIDTVLERGGHRFVLTDTAGMRRKRSIAQRVEQFAVVRGMRAVDDADVVALVLDAMEAGADQDAKLAGIVAEKGRALLVVVNKWDLAEAAGATRDWYRQELRKRLPFVAWAPLLFVSARDGHGVERLLGEAARIAAEYRSRFPTPRLNEVLAGLQEEHPAPLARGRPVKLYYIAQVGASPPTFLIQCSRPEAIGDAYRRFVENRFRAAFRLRVPLRFVYRERQRRRRARSGGDA
jgi:GTP-binding protein